MFVEKGRIQPQTFRIFGSFCALHRLMCESREIKCFAYGVSTGLPIGLLIGLRNYEATFRQTSPGSRTRSITGTRAGAYHRGKSFGGGAEDREARRFG